jgi:type IV pilus assembly protein PilW
VRLAVLARSEHYEKPSTPGGACEATTAANRPTWSGGDFLTFNAPGALPSCYKYRMFETVVPMRNMIWRPE